MKMGVIDTKGDFHELPFYEIQGLCGEIVNTAISKNEEYKNKFEEYKNKITRFSPEFEFCIHELGWYLYDPFCLGNDEVLFSNGNRCYIAPMDFVNKEGFNRHDVKNEDKGYPVLTDENVKYDSTLKNDSLYEEGIVDERGYVSASFVPNIETLAEIELMTSMIGSKEVYLDYMRFKNAYSSKLEYLTSKKNVISVKRLEDGTFTLQFVSGNDGIVGEFIQRLNNEEKIAELDPMLGNEHTSIMKAA